MKNLYDPIDRTTFLINREAHLPVNPWWDVWKRLKKNRLAIIGLFTFLLLLILSIIGPWITPYAYYEINLNMKNRPPSAIHWFGTDELGRDLFARTWWGARISLFVAIVASFIDLVIGVLYGAIAGMVGKKTDELMMRFADILYSIPYLLIVILLMVMIEPGIMTILIALTLTGWINMARIVRSQILQLKELDFIKAARLLGASNLRILLKHLIPNCAGIIIVTVTFTIPIAIFAEAFLSFLGLGVQAPVASWGTMANDGLPALRYYPWRLFFPAIFISLTMLSFNLLGDGLRDAFDPRMER
ncbi:MAG: ABC transporter permease [Chlamydiae bacterium]|nr:ABC transporter permease [Chlamydiota bacterium]